MMGKRRRTLRWLTVAALAGGMGLAALASAQSTRTPIQALSAARETPRIESGQKFFGDAKFVGAESCKACHAKQYDEWRETWHAKMERWPTPEIIVGDFNDRAIQWRNIRIRDKDGKELRISPSGIAFRKGDRFYFTLLDKDNSANNQTHEVAKVLRGKWDQGYEVRIGNNFIPAPIRWSVASRDWLIGGFRVDEWFVVDGTLDGRPRRPEELPLGRVAEAKCNGCHTTGFEFVKDKATGVWKGVGNGELGIACEKCHGPGSRHLQEANDARSKGLSLRPEATTIVHPLKDLNALQQTELCGQCHGRNTNKTATELSFPTGFLPGDVDMTTRSCFWSYSGTNNPDEYQYFWPKVWASRNRQQWQDFTRSTHFNKAERRGDDARPGAGRAAGRGRRRGARGLRARQDPRDRGGVRRREASRDRAQGQAERDEPRRRPARHGARSHPARRRAERPGPADRGALRGQRCRAAARGRERRDGGFARA
jgi:hypothetical protein